MKEQLEKINSKEVDQPKGVFKIELVNEDGSIEKEVYSENVVKSVFLQESVDNVGDESTQITGVSASRREYDSQPAYVGTPSITGIMLMDDPLNLAGNNFSMVEGTPVGIIAVGENNDNASSVVLGNRVTTEFTTSRNFETDQVTETFVGEFGSLQGNGTFSKIGFMAKPSYVNEGLHNEVFENVTVKYAPLYAFSRYHRVLKKGSPPSSESVFYLTADTPAVRESKLFNYSLTTIARKQAQIISCLTTCADGELFMVRHNTVIDSAAPFSIVHVSNPPDAYMSQEGLAPQATYPSLFETPQTGIHSLNNGTTFSACLSYDPVNKVLYYVRHAHNTQVMDIQSYSFVSEGVWTANAAFTLTTTADATASTNDSGLAMAINAAGTKAHIIRNGASNTTEFISFNITPTSASNIVERIRPNLYTSLNRNLLGITSCSYIDDNTAYVVFEQNSATNQYLHHRYMENTGQTQGNNKVGFYLNLDNNDEVVGAMWNKQALGMAGNFMTTTLAGATQGGHYGLSLETSPLHFGIVVSSNTNDNKSPFITTLDTFTLELFGVYFGATTQWDNRLYAPTFYKLPTSRTSTNALISAGTFAPVTKIEGQSLKVTYSITRNG